MTRKLYVILFAITVSVAGTTAIEGPIPAASEGDVSVYFSPNGGCADAIIREINGAKNSVRVQAYDFTSARIATAITGAHKRGLTVTLVFDSRHRASHRAAFFHNMGVPTFIDADHTIAHNKIILIDDDTIITGSFDFTTAAEERNAENLLIIKNKPKLVRAYRDNFNRHMDHSVLYSGKGEG